MPDCPRLFAALLVVSHVACSAAEPQSAATSTARQDVACPAPPAALGGPGADGGASEDAVPALEATTSPTMRVVGRGLVTAAGEPILLRGANKMNIWTDRDGSISFPAIRAAGANSVRIVWATKSGAFTPTAADLDLVIGNAIEQKLVPMIELHDATGNLGRLGALVDYWTRPDIVAVLARHERWLLVNVGNEVGDDTVTTAEYVAAYEPALLRMRAAGIRTPLVLDAPDWGKNIDVVLAAAPALMAVDPAKNTMFSVHTYWAKNGGQGAAYVRAKLGAAAAEGLPLVLGEVSRYGAYAGAASKCTAAGEVDDATVLEQSDTHAIGWYAWEWGPGNVGGGDPLCTVMDMTTDGKLGTLQPGWATDVVYGPHGWAATSRLPASLVTP